MSAPYEYASEQEREHFEYLDELRESGVTNMYGAVPYLQREFGLERREASDVLVNWMKTFAQRHPNTDGA